MGFASWIRLRIGGRKGLLVEGIASGRERRASGESIAQRSRRSQRGIADWRAEGLLVDSSLLGGKDAHRGRASHRGHGGHRGGLRIGGGKGFGGKHRFWAGKTRVGEEHRTEG